MINTIAGQTEKETDTLTICMGEKMLLCFPTMYKMLYQLAKEFLMWINDSQNIFFIVYHPMLLHK